MSLAGKSFRDKKEGELVIDPDDFLPGTSKIPKSTKRTKTSEKIRRSAERISSSLSHEELACRGATRPPKTLDNQPTFSHINHAREQMRERMRELQITSSTPSPLKNTTVHPPQPLPPRINPTPSQDIFEKLIEKTATKSSSLFQGEQTTFGTTTHDDAEDTESDEEDTNTLGLGKTKTRGRKGSLDAIHTFNQTVRGMQDVDDDDLYGVSPPRTPRPRAQSLSRPPSMINLSPPPLALRSLGNINPPPLPQSLNDTSLQPFSLQSWSDTESSRSTQPHTEHSRRQKSRRKYDDDDDNISPLRKKPRQSSTSSSSYSDNHPDCRLCIMHCENPAFNNKPRRKAAAKAIKLQRDFFFSLQKISQDLKARAEEERNPKSYRKTRSSKTRASKTSTKDQDKNQGSRDESLSSMSSLEKKLSNESGPSQQIREEFIKYSTDKDAEVNFSYWAAATRHLSIAHDIRVNDEVVKMIAESDPLHQHFNKGRDDRTDSENRKRKRERERKRRVDDVDDLSSSENGNFSSNHTHNKENKKRKRGRKCWNNCCTCSTPPTSGSEIISN